MPGDLPGQRCESQVLGRGSTRPDVDRGDRLRRVSSGPRSDVVRALLEVAQAVRTIRERCSTCAGKGPVHATIAFAIAAWVNEFVTVPLIVPELGTSAKDSGVGFPVVTTTFDCDPVVYSG